MNWCALGLEQSPESAPRPAPDRPRRRCCHRSAPADGLPAAAAHAGRTAGDRCQGVFRGRRNARTYFVLECREIYDYNDSDMAAQNGKIIAQIVAIGRLTRAGEMPVLAHF